jgi:DNA-binding PadR family transcriptional regulator
LREEAKVMFGPKMMKGFFGWGRGHGFDPRRGRMFEKGDLKYVILDLLKDKPSHGYEVMRALEERFRGFYSPSPGSVYPTLQLLEDLGYVSATQRDGKKVYEITDEGRKFLEENKRAVKDIWGRVGGGWDPEVTAELHEMRHEVMDLGRLFGRQMHEGRLDREKLRRIREVISGAARDIERILEDRDAAGGTPV